MTDELDSYQEYRRRINLMADVIEDEYEGEKPLSELVFEFADSSRMVMFDHNNIKALEYADSQPEQWQPFVSPEHTWRDVLQAMAFTAVRQDLWAELRDRGVEQ